MNGLIKKQNIPFIIVPNTTDINEENNVGNVSNDTIRTTDSFITETNDDCASECAKNKDCNMFVWHKHDVTDRALKKKCILKKSITTNTKTNDKIYSGIKADSNNISSEFYRFTNLNEPDDSHNMYGRTNTLIGDDISYNTTNIKDCEKRWLDNDECNGFVWHNSDWENKWKHKCILKKTIGNYTIKRHDNVIYHVKKKLFVDTDEELKKTTDNMNRLKNQFQDDNKSYFNQEIVLMVFTVIIIIISIVLWA